MSTQNLGRIKWFNNRKGFGFLTDCETNDDIFVHFSAIQTPDDVYKSLIEGEYVQYQPGTDKDGKSVALNVTGVAGGPLLCQNKERRIYSVKRETEETSEKRQTRKPNRRQNRKYEKRTAVTSTATQEEATAENEEAEMAQLETPQ